MIGVDGGVAEENRLNPSQGSDAVRANDIHEYLSEPSPGHLLSSRDGVVEETSKVSMRLYPEVLNECLLAYHVRAGAIP